MSTDTTNTSITKQELEALKNSMMDHIETNIMLRQQLAEKDAMIKELREALQEFDALIKHQYSGTREAMSDMTYAAQRGMKALAIK